MKTPTVVYTLINRHPCACHLCSAPFYRPPGSISTDYGTERNETEKTETRICFACIAKQDIAETEAGPETICAYVSGDSAFITNWPGAKLLRITGRATCTLARLSWTHGKDYSTYWARNRAGVEYVGRGSPGICIKMRRTKAPLIPQAF